MDLQIYQASNLGYYDFKLSTFFDVYQQTLIADLNKNHEDSVRTARNYFQPWNDDWKELSIC